MKAALVQVRISKTIFFEYETRSVFEDVLEYANDAGSDVVKVSRATAEAMFSDAVFNGDANNGPSEMPRAYGNAYRALAKQLKKALS